MKIIAHGGYSGKCKENTLEAYEAAVEFNPDYIEMDVMLGPNSTPICAHPKTRNQLKILKTKEALSRLKTLGSKSGIYFDLKQENRTLINALITLCTKLKYKQKKLLFGVRSKDFTKEFRNKYPNIRIIGLWENPDTFQDFFSLGGDIFRIKEKDFTKKRIRYIHKIGGEVWVVPKTSGQGINRDTGETTLEKLRTFMRLQVDGVIMNNLELTNQL